MTQGRYDGKVMLVTGGGSGIGRATVLRFLDEGARVVIADYNEAAARETAALAGVRGAGERVAVVRADVASEADNAAMVAVALERFGRLDFAFLNAGVGGAFGPIADTTVEEWDYTFHVLVRGVFLGMKHCAQPMRAAGGGAIVVTASIAGVSGGAGSHAYSAAKRAVISLTESVAVEFAGYGIRVNAVAPGTIMTPLLHRGRPDQLKPSLTEQPWPERGAPEHIASVVAFLCSDDARFVVGETVVVDGGRIAQGMAMFGAGADNILLRRAGVNRGSTGEAGEVRDPGR
ncbi:MAG TPA: SDR family NAD(P)-dependent oxidoreductase [Quisquiliibacterium sp.]|jgi:NAD(P)-dependent dehydrogenase (short-subunit alcohol dehydrogenase family)|nr:SDR family NAD(P)-dependent oxidoreductase [Quisquiliibacterium sp.]HPA88448.1 SDR family NAD(P)-dependent oxidoreductase [Quisquiliibacterium sp.]HQD81864.1 SDR family NAD(P)-dependent oxidoreductase [Quisquiliibacterium sp.]HQN11340.1 SDR family NAD(P)-dependent oxidoreductase [Quisquiliibacterium sp.]HQP68278.1 SDR family NAD(P)-dependent oxidoreductase [Quisquiliibacterium sp.]